MAASSRTIPHGGAAVAASVVEAEADEVGTEDAGAPGVRRRKASPSRNITIPETALLQSLMAITNQASQDLGT